MKKIILFVLTMFLLISLTSCGVHKKVKGSKLDKEAAEKLADEIRVAYDERKDEPFKGWISIDQETTITEREKDGSYEITKMKVTGKVFESSDLEKIKAVIEYKETIKAYDVETTIKSVSVETKKLIHINGQSFIKTKTKHTVSSNYGKSKETEVEREMMNAEEISIPVVGSTVSIEKSILDDFLLHILTVLNYQDCFKKGNTIYYENSGEIKKNIIAVSLDKNLQAKKVTLYKEENRVDNTFIRQVISKTIIKKSTGRIVIKPIISKYEYDD